MRRSRAWQSRRSPATTPSPVPGLSEPQAEVGEGALSVHVDDEPGHPAAPDLEQVCSLRLHLPDLQSARLAPPREVDETQPPLVVKLAVLLDLDAEVLPGAEPLAVGLRHPGQSLPCARFWPVG